MCSVELRHSIRFKEPKCGLKSKREKKKNPISEPFHIDFDNFVLENSERDFSESATWKMHFLYPAHLQNKSIWISQYYCSHEEIP